MNNEITLPKESSKSLEIISRYGNIENALNKLHPVKINDAINKYSIRSNRQAYLTDSISLATFAKTYSKDGCIGLIELYLFDLSEFVGVNGKISPMQSKQLAELIYSEAYGLNFAEFGLFFSRVKKGLYGEFYGNVDPVKIMTFLGQFLVDRSKSIEDYNKELDQEKKRKDFQDCLNMQLTDEQKADISEIRNNFIKRMNR